MYSSVKPKYEAFSYYLFYKARMELNQFFIILSKNMASLIGFEGVFRIFFYLFFPHTMHCGLKKIYDITNKVMWVMCSIWYKNDNYLYFYQQERKFLRQYNIYKVLVQIRIYAIQNEENSNARCLVKEKTDKLGFITSKGNFKMITFCWQRKGYNFGFFSLKKN